MTAALRVGTRRSPLALRQAGEVARGLEALLDQPVELVEVTTRGDVDRAPLASIGGAGVFVSALRDAVLADEVDVAVHSLKDLPTAPADGLWLAAIPPRQDPRDALVADAHTLATLPAGARVGTGSPRRAAALRAMGRDWQIKAIRGNVDTRLQMVRSAALEAVVLAVAGLARLARNDVPAEPIDPQLMPPAPGQGALALEARVDLEGPARHALAALDHSASRAAVLAERALLASLQAGCSAPVGALAEHRDGSLTLRARVWSADGADTVSGQRTGSPDDPVVLGDTLAERLLADGAADFLASLRPTSTISPDPKERAL